MADKKVYYYGRAGSPVVERLREFQIPENLNPKREQIKEALSILDDKAYFSTYLLDRLMWHLKKQLDVPKAVAEDLIAKRFGYAGWPGLKRSKTLDEEYHRSRAKLPTIQAQIRGDMRSGKAIAIDLREEAQKKEREHRRLMIGELGGPAGGVKHKTYFFHQHPEYVEIIEGLMADYNDCYLQAAVDNYPNRMDNDLYYTSFGLFWREVMKLQTTGKVDFSIPGMMLIKQLCHYLYSWNFRRYMADEVIARYAPFLPVKYRCDHIAIKRDASPQVIVDETYQDLEFEEDPNDNIGNR